MLRPAFTIALALALGSTAAAIAGASAPTAKPDKPKPTTVTDTAEPGTGGGAMCGPPTKANCTSERFITGICAKPNEEACRTFVEDALKAKHKAATTAPMIKMLRPNKTQMPADVRTGKYFPYSPDKSFKAAAKKLQAQWAKKTKVILAKKPKVKKAGHFMNVKPVPMAMQLTPKFTGEPGVDRVTRVSASDAAKTHRQPAWDANQGKIESCAEFGYEANYDITRFIDAATGCRGDKECVFEVAYLPTTPGIARRVLQDKDGEPLKKQLYLAQRTYPKNDLMAIPSEFIFSNGNRTIESTPDLEDLKKALDEGNGYYSIGQCSGAACDGVKSFASEWDWHAALHDANKHISQNELEEYERRRAELRGLLEQLAAARRSEENLLLQKETQPLMPFDILFTDPLKRYEIEQQLVRPPTKAIKAIEKKFGKDIWKMSPKDAAKQVHGALEPQGGGSIAGVLAAPISSGSKTQPKSKAGGNRPKPTKKGAGKDKMSDCARLEGWGFETFRSGPISCKIGKFLREEWARKKAGQKSCLDLSNKGCDWSPAMFEARILAPIPLLDQQLADEGFCEDWRDGLTLPKDSVASLRTKLGENKEKFEKAWKELKSYDQGTNANGRSFGGGWPSSEYVGDKKWFAAGYATDMGWSVAPLAKQNELICELGGSMRATADFDAWILGGKVNVAGAAVHVRVNEGKHGKVEHKAWMKVFDQVLFSEPESSSSSGQGWATSQPFTPEPSMGLGVSLPVPKPRFDIYVGVPISGELWGELMNSQNLSVKGKASTGCNTADPRFSMNASFTPYFGAFGMGQVGIGISGVVSGGIRAALNLLTLGLPVTIGMAAAVGKDEQNLTFNSQIGLLLGTLSGRVSLYLEFLMYEDEWELFRWNGIGPATIPLMPLLEVDLPLSGMN